MKLLMILALTLFSLATVAAEDKSVVFVFPSDGATVPTKFLAKFTVTGMKIKPAGQDVDDKTSGHLHILVDSKPVAEGQVIPADATHLHFGKGQIEGEVKLPPGKHTLTLQFADGLHRAYGKDLTKTIHVTVK